MSGIRSQDMNFKTQLYLMLLLMSKKARENTCLWSKKRFTFLTIQTKDLSSFVDLTSLDQRNSQMQPHKQS